MALVAALHLLTTAATWVVTDQAEALLTARQLITEGTLDLAPPDSGRPPLPWLHAEPGQPVRTRLLPLTALTLAPLLALDRLLGLERPVDYGRVVHLQGHLFALAGVALVGVAVWRRLRSPAAAAAAVLLTGTAWPVWQVSKRAGSPPILFFLVALFLAAGAAPAGSRRTARADVLRAACCALLPWASPLGSVVSAVLVAAAWLEARAPRPPSGDGRPRVAPLAAGCAIGSLSLILLWNHLYHGDWAMGGYGAREFGHEGWFGAVPFTTGLLVHLAELLRLVPWIVLPLWAALRAGREGRAALALPVVLTGVLLALFATFYDPEPARRLSVVCAAWGVAAGWAWAQAGWRYPWNLAVLAGALVVGCAWFLGEEGRYYQGPGGHFYPSVLWVKLALEGAPAWQTLAPVSGLLAIAAVSADRVAAAMRPR